MVALAVSETSIGLAIVGGYIVIFGLVSYLLKDKFFLCERERADVVRMESLADEEVIVFAAEALLALIAGIIFGPVAADWFSPLRWTGSEESLNSLT